MANVAVSRLPRARVGHSGGGPSTRPILWLLWLGFLAILALSVVAAAEVGLRLRRNWIASHLTATPIDDSRFVADRLLRYTNRPDYTYESQNESGAVLHYSNNSLGLRGPNFAVARPPGVTRIVLVGGSTVYGALNDDRDTIAAQLQSVLRERLGRDVEVINAGVPGFDGFRELVFTRSHVLDLKPDVVIVMDGLNDVFYGTLQEWPAQIAADELGVIAEGRYPDIVAAVDSTMFPAGLLEHQVQMMARSVRRTWNVAWRVIPAEPRIVNERVVALHATSLGLVAQYGRQSNAHVVAALQPLLATGHKQLSEAEKAAVEHEGYWSVGGWQEVALDMYPRLARTTQASVTAAGGTFLDLTGAFDAETGATYAEDAVHYTSLGNRRLAEALAGSIEQWL